MYIFIIVLSALLDIVANLLLKKSDGFKNKIWGLAAIVNAILAFFSTFFFFKICSFKHSLLNLGCYRHHRNLSWWMDFI